MEALPTNTRDMKDRSSSDRTAFRTWIEVIGFLAVMGALGACPAGVSGTEGVNDFETTLACI